MRGTARDARAPKVRREKAGPWALSSGAGVKTPRSFAREAWLFGGGLLGGGRRRGCGRGRGFVGLHRERVLGHADGLGEALADLADLGLVLDAHPEHVLDVEHVDDALAVSG